MVFGQILIRLCVFANFQYERLKSVSKLIFFFIHSHQDWYDETWKIKQMIFMKVHEDKNGFISPLIYKLLRIFARKSGLGNGLMSHFGVLVLNHSFNNTVSCLHGLCVSMVYRGNFHLPPPLFDKNLIHITISNPYI